MTILVEILRYHKHTGIAISALYMKLYLLSENLSTIESYNIILYNSQTKKDSTRYT